MDSGGVICRNAGKQLLHPIHFLCQRGTKFTDAGKQRLIRGKLLRNVGKTAPVAQNLLVERFEHRETGLRGILLPEQIDLFVDALRFPAFFGRVSANHLVVCVDPRLRQRAVKEPYLKNIRESPSELFRKEAVQFRFVRFRQCFHDPFADSGVVKELR